MYIRKTSIFVVLLNTAALIACMSGCAPDPAPTPTQYNLTISSTEGGEVTGPGEGILTYDAGEVVDLVAEAEEGYSFVNWTGNIGTIANVNSASSTIAMNGTYSITANFKAHGEVYDLTISSTTEGWLLCGNVTTPGEGTFSYSSGTVVNLVAQAEEVCQFVGWSGDVGTIADVNAATTTITINGDYFIRANFRSYVSRVLAAGGFHTIGLKSDGTVVAVGYNAYGQCNVGGWTDITQVAAGGGHTVGLKSDGTVVAVGSNKYGQCDVASRSWTNIIQVAGGWVHTVGLKSGGTVVAAGDHAYGQCNVGGWTDIIQVSAGSWHTVGLRTDGTAVALGDNTYGQCNVVDWSAILQIAAGYWHTVGVKDDRTVVAVGDNYYGPCDVVGWTDIVHVAAGRKHTVGLRSDGTVVAAGNNAYGPCDVGGWHLF